MIMSKRINMTDVSSLSYLIRPETLRLSLDLNNYLNEIISHQIKVSSILPLFGEDIPKLKYAIYLLRNYIIVEIDSKEKDQCYLTENNEQLIDLLCSLISFPDNQVKYEVLWCLLNLTYFPPQIEKHIYSYNNLELIYEAIELRDNVIFTLLIDLISNCCTVEDRNRIFFLNQNIMSDLCEIYRDETTNADSKTKIIKCVSMLSKIIPSMNNYLIYFKEIIKLFKPNLLKKNESSSSFYYVYVLLKNITSFNNYMFDVLLTDDFAINLFDLYYTNPSNTKIKWLIIIINFSLGSDKNKQLLIDKGIIDLLNEALNEYQFNSNNMLRHVIFGITNIANGTISQIDLLWNCGILKTLLDISKRVYDELKIQSLHNDNSILFADILYAFCNSIAGSSNEIHNKLLDYNKGLILRIIMQGIKEYQTNHLLIWNLLRSIKESILFEKNNMIDISIRTLLIEEDIEDLLNLTSLNSPIEDNQLLSEEILEIILQEMDF